VKARARVAAGGLVAFLAAAGPETARAAVKPGLEGGQDLFRRNHWSEARELLRSQWGMVPEKDRPAATFLIGRSYAREAEFYGAVRRVEAEVGLAYMQELASARANRNVAWVPLFTGLHELAAGMDKEAERTLLPVGARPLLPMEWKATARLRRAVALHRLGRAAEAAAALKEPSPESRFCRLLLTGVADPPPAAPQGRRERLLTAPVLFRASRAAEAEAVLSGLDLDAPDVEDKSDPKKVLRFHDPLLATAWERICWERTVVALRPLAVGGTGAEKRLAAYYAGLGLFRLGVAEESTKLLTLASDPSLGAELQPSARLLISASSWKGPVSVAELSSAWEATQVQPDSVLLWEELRRPDLANAEPFATRLETRLRELLSPSPERPSGALVGRWGLARLRRGDDPAAVLAVLSEHQDKSNKNKLEWNDPLLLLALTAANYRDQEYAQALETLFELSKTLPGLRALQWNMQGIYAARQKAGGEARISQ
jgi:hypothetical protein